MLNIKQQQTVKFFLLCFFSVVGLYLFVTTGGTLIEASLIYAGFWVMSRIHMVTHHKWLGHNEISPGPLGRAFLLWVLVSCNLVKPVHYIVCHRLHHKYADTDRDPHCNSIGFWNLLIGNLRIPKNPYVHMKDIFRQKDIMFVNRYYYYLYFLNLLIFWMINPHIIMLSFSLLNLKVIMNATIFNYLAHGGKDGRSPINMPLWMLLIFGYWGEHKHKNHHDDIDKYLSSKGV